MITVISGMVRAGTSMVAEALKQGGIPLLYDPKLPNTDPTDDFPHNSFDMNKQIELVRKPATLDGHVIKLMASVLMEIPRLARPNVKVIWMHRKPRCVLASIAHADAAKGIIRETPTPRMAKKTERFWRKRIAEAGFDMCLIPYEKCVRNPVRWLGDVELFLNYPGFDLGAAIAVIDPTKWRQR